MAPGRRPTVRQNPLVNRSTNRNNVDINSGIDTQKLDQLIATRVAEELAAAAVTHAASTQEETNLGFTRWFEKLDLRTGISQRWLKCKDKFASSTLLSGALTWKIVSSKMKSAIEKELMNLKVKGHKLTATLNLPRTSPLNCMKQLKWLQGLMYQVVQERENCVVDKRNGQNHTQQTTPNITSNLNPNKRLETARVFTAGQGSYVGKLPYCGKCGRHYTDACPPTYHNYGRAGHKVKDCLAPPRHYKNKCSNNGSQSGGNQIQVNQQNPQNNQRQNQGNPKGSNQASTNTRGGRKAPDRVYSLCAKAVVKDNNVVNGTFLINIIYASVLFDIGEDRSFMSYAFSKYIDIHPTTLDTNYSMELADGKSLTTSTILRGCTLNLQNHLFKIGLLPIELGSFDVIVRMDWMAKHRAEVMCYEKYNCVPYKNDMLIIQGEMSGIKSELRLEVISSIRKCS
ncbi:putative reverse transcriptase domain-containing protein [Tanacetum coccineum]